MLSVSCFNSYCCWFFHGVTTLAKTDTALQNSIVLLCSNQNVLLKSKHYAIKVWYIYGPIFIEQLGTDGYCKRYNACFALIENRARCFSRRLDDSWCWASLLAAIFSVLIWIRYNRDYGNQMWRCQQRMSHTPQVPSLFHIYTVFCAAATGYQDQKHRRHEN